MVSSLQMKKADSIEWQNDQQQKVQQYLMETNDLILYMKPIISLVEDYLFELLAC